MIEILTTAGLCSVQDLGRDGQYFQGLGRAGAMDALALQLGNLLLGNPQDAAGIEVQMMPFRLRFLTAQAFAVTGADCAADLDGQALPPFWRAEAQPGQVLTLGPVRRGCRAYVALQGGVDVPQVLGGRATQLREGFGGFEGRFLRPGDRLQAAATRPGAGTIAGYGLLPPSRALPQDSGDAITLRVLPAGEYPDFTDTARRDFETAIFRVSRQINRTGYRLEGPPLLLETPRELRSHGVVPGVIQVPPGGQAIIQLADAATMGGYPKIATVIEADLWRLGQAAAGAALRFQPVSLRAAEAAAAEVTAYLARLERGLNTRAARAAAWRQA
ncbi:biotin-dependent carboxyltransferase family protein [Phaeovulum sp. W22_SRMD_FR3]|uniref:5-oxoprolinase subunit C family protein n=1 Tax=Phaeovulum sp. W22_SRMD_FR3 TaxID=3240274 RepID=UPI003F9AF04E